MDAANVLLTKIQHNNDNFASSTIHLKPTPDGSYIEPPKKRNSTTNNTFYVISMDDEHAYAMLATLEGPIRTQLHTPITIRGTDHSQIIHIQ